MNPFTKHTGIVAAMNRANVDTDQIIPKQFLKRIERSGFGQFLFYDWRFHDNGTDNPDFELNQGRFQGASILVAARNFGSGSSREHAVWALADYGFRSIVAPSFADIFYNNCFKNGVLPVQLDEAVVNDIFSKVAANDGYKLTIDLENCSVTDESGMSQSFQIDSARRERLLHGQDDIAATLEHESKISEFEAKHGISVAT